MGKYILRKLIALIPKILLISLMVFFALELLPGDPLRALFQWINTEK